MKLPHTLRATSAAFDDPNLVSTGGLVPVLALAESAGLQELADEHLSVPTDKGASAGLKVASLVAGMVAGADPIDDVALLRHGGIGRVFARAYANLTRAAGIVAAPDLERATTATIRRKLTTVPARVATSARRTTLHLPKPGPGRPPGSFCSTELATPPPPRGLTTQQPPLRDPRINEDDPDSEVRQHSTPRHAHPSAIRLTRSPP